MASDHTRHGNGSGRSLAVGALAVASGALAFAAINRFLRYGRISRPEDAPPRTLRRQPPAARREAAIVGRSVTINRPRHELYGFWRDFSKFPEFMENVRAVTSLGDDRWRWTIAAPAGTEVTFETRITEDQPNELIAWESEEGSAIRNSGRVLFRDAPGGRGTEVEVTISYDPPGGTAGQLAAKLFQREPHIQARHELKRFKQLMESGEIATAEPRAGDAERPTME